MRTIHVVGLSYYSGGQRQHDFSMKLGKRSVKVQVHDDEFTRLVVVTDTTQNLPSNRLTSEADIYVQRRPGESHTMITIGGNALRGLPRPPRPLLDDTKLGIAIMDALNVALPEYKFV